MDQTTSQAEGIQKVASAIEGIKFAMLSTVGPDGQLRSRPMTTLQETFDGDLWFFTSKDHTVAEDVQYKSHVNLAYSNPDKNEWLSVSGEAALVEDEAKKRELWKDDYQEWFPGGVDDPSLVLLKVTATCAEHWDASGKMTTLLGMNRAGRTT